MINCSCYNPIMNECKGEVKQYKIVSAADHQYPNRDWGIFTYCESCIQEDIKQGMIVKEVK